ncbi:MAG: Xaa-Pro dipeptidase [Gammaproteobacteria bacterium]|nr:Xaa-Pro dipeptidase [Gammaproteobacteria bacterium]
MQEISIEVESLYKDHLAQIQRRYEKALESCQSSGVLIPSGSLKYAFLDDHSYPFKVNPHFKTWLPVEDNDESFILMRPGEKPLLLFNQPEDYWHQPASDPDDFWVEEWEIQSIRSLIDASNRIGDPRSLVFVGEETDLAREWGIGQINPQTFLSEVHYGRANKTDYELACLQIANNIAVQGHRAAEEAFRLGCSEFEIQHRYLAAIAHREKESPYSAIVGLNEHCAILHYQHYDRQAPTTTYSLLIDAGANKNGYAADITRTYATGNGLFRDLINAMNKQQLAIIDEIQPGLNYADLHEKMHLRLAGVLRDFQIVDMEEADMVESNLTFTFLPHGLGHLLGLQTHDVAGLQQSPRGDEKAAPEKYPALRLTRTIENRQVFTIEPGLYFIPMLLNKLRQSAHASQVNWQLIEELVPCGGIRIEDNIAMLEGRPINLTRNAFDG